MFTYVLQHTLHSRTHTTATRAAEYRRGKQNVRRDKRQGELCGNGSMFIARVSLFVLIKRVSLVAGLPGALETTCRGITTRSSSAYVLFRRYLPKFRS